MTALPAEQVSPQPLPLAVTLTTDTEKHERACLSALDQLDDLIGLSQAQSDARRYLRNKWGAR